MKPPQLLLWTIRALAAVVLFLSLLFVGDIVRHYRTSNKPAPVHP